MQLRPIRRHVPKPPPNIEAILQSADKYITEEQLAEILGLTVRQAVIKAYKLGFARIPIKKSRCYAKRQIVAWLNERGNT